MCRQEMTLKCNFQKLRESLGVRYGVDVDAPVPMWRTPALVGSVIVYVLVLAGVVVILRRRKYNKTLANTNAGADVSKA